MHQYIYTGRNRSNTATDKLLLPPMLMGATLIFWGWHTGLWWLGIPLGILAELPPYLSNYWEFTLHERQRVADMCNVLLILAGGYLYFNQPHTGAVVILMMQWAPALLFPLLAIQLYGGRNGIELSVLFLSLRNNRPGGEQQVDLRPVYLIICLVGAAMVIPPSTSYYVGLSIISIGVLWPLRSSNTKWWQWLLYMMMAMGIGYGIGHGLVTLQAALEEQVVVWLLDYLDNDSRDPYKTTTVIGEIGRLKLSEQIMLRTWPDGLVLDEPLLLRSASFSSYAHGIWLAERYPFQSIPYDPDGRVLTSGVPPQQWIKIAMELQQGQGVLPLPNGSLVIKGLKGAQLSINAAKAVTVTEGPALATYMVGYAAPKIANTPQEHDRKVPPIERPVLEQIVQDLNLRHLSPRHAMMRLQAMLQQDFRYSLKLSAKSQQHTTAIADFLSNTRTGHCEYFATAAVLILRQAGIPARYAQGWSVQEYSDLEQAYIARARHAHAWVLVWLDGAWQDFDPTPSTWANLEADARPWWGIMQDLWSWWRYRMVQEDEPTPTRDWWLLAGLFILVALLAWRIIKRSRSTAKPTSALNNANLPPTGVFTPIERILAAIASPRQQGETLLNWLLRLQDQGQVLVSELLPILELYYQQRFDPQGLGVLEQQQLEARITGWLSKYSANSTSTIA